MLITIDTETRVLQLTEGGTTREYSLFSAEAFRLLSLQWIVLGWNLGHWSTLSWMGRRLLQLPDDVLLLAELFWMLRPDVIVETGVYDGGTTLLFASLCRLSVGRVIAVESEFRPGVRDAIGNAAGDLALLIEGDSAAAETALRVGRNIRPGERVCVFLDADHSARHVAAEMRNFGSMVSPGCYLIVADSICPELAHTPQGEMAWMKDHPGKAPSMSSW